MTVGEALARHLGDPRDTRYLIINCDDLGSSHAANVASLKAMDEGIATSATLMAPCPWAREAAEMFKGRDVGVHLTLTAVLKNSIVAEHPDTLNPVSGIQVPGWDGLLDIAARSWELTGLASQGIDIVLDRDLGPLILELNARPGLAIQMANGNGLLLRLKKVEALRDSGGLSTDPAERAEFAKQNFPTLG